MQFELRGRERLHVDLHRGLAGLYLLGREEARALEACAPEGSGGRARQALLLLRKHADGRRVVSLERVAGERTVVVGLAGASLVLRLGGAAPCLTLALEGRGLCSLGGGPPAFPPPEPAPERTLAALDGTVLERANEELLPRREAVRAILAACPELGPLLARDLVDGRLTTGEIGALPRTAAPFLLAPFPLEGRSDRDLAGAEGVLVSPLPLPRAGLVPLAMPSWRSAAASFLAARWRAAAFEGRRRAALDAGRREQRRLTQLELNLGADLAQLPEAGDLRRRGEALLASAEPLRPDPDTAEVEVPDPYEPSRVLRFAVEPTLGRPANADRLFEKARRAERARVQIGSRLGEVRAALVAAEARLAAVEAAERLEELPAPSPRPRAGTPRQGGTGRPPRGGRKEVPARPRTYLTSRGLPILLGRSARENQRLTFEVAAPDDYWLHARDVPGAHVVLRDPERRAAPADLQEAAEVAAFHSDAAGSSWVDVHVARRKHLRPGGTPGRVLMSHSETLRVRPRDPEGRLRRR